MTFSAPPRREPKPYGSAISTPVCGGLAYLLGSDPILRYALSALGAVPVLLLAVGYIYFMLRDPNRLQSEEFVTRQQELLLLARKFQPPVPAHPELSGDIAPEARIEEDGP